MNKDVAGRSTFCVAFRDIKVSALPPLQGLHNPQATLRSLAVMKITPFGRLAPQTFFEPNNS
ncbi:MAG: hypothetical protein LBD35_04480 [Prevotellaceae bacterium]|jgi:hypothetical protein|nr:hypothetical protein [Prevotellaceae bacterium]